MEAGDSGEPEAFLKVRDDEVCEKTLGSNFWSFQSLYFFGAQPAARHTAEGQYVFIEQANTPGWKKGLCKRVKGQWEGAGGPSCALQWRLGGEKHRPSNCLHRRWSRQEKLHVTSGGGPSSNSSCGSHKSVYL